MPGGMNAPCCQEKFYMGFKECLDELMRYFVEKHSLSPQDPLLQNLMEHLQEQSQKFSPREAGVYSFIHLAIQYSISKIIQYYIVIFEGNYKSRHFPVYYYFE